MRGWIYVLEIAPSGRIKVGRTETLARRLSKHLAAASFGGGQIVRVLSFMADDPESAERELLAMIAAHPRSSLAHGRETFSGLTFMEVAGLAEQVTGYRTGSPWEPGTGDFLGLCAAALDTAGATRASLDYLLELLGDDGPPTKHDLGRALRRAGAKTSTVWCPARGKTAQGVKREWLTLEAVA